MAVRRLKDLAKLFEPDPNDPRVQKAYAWNATLQKLGVVGFLFFGAITPIFVDAPYVPFLGIGCAAGLAVLSGLALFKIKK